MALAGCYLINNHSDIILKYTSLYEDYVREGTDKKFWLVNTNKLVRFFDGADGLKTGHTDAARYCMAVTAKRGNMRLLAFISLIAGILISFGFIYFDLTNKRMMLYNIALVFILGGCFGNMIDRFFRPDLGVVDFIEPVFVDFAIFNVADSFLTVGAILLAIHTIFVSDKPKEKKEEVKEETVND